ncbi:FxsB family radical SAM/SPASM domain protein [Algoriphagus sp. H41]|uniref:FxsB family radical SAM/SPASM domain protein n=1 Tax=Algoriphagus oliviformis TaxID=2811231 RepID=A0ABS3CAX6_9BACT|nr:FxsB family cyclophane-forming radical SAM/SPASM peptide maturase [Algoriphagus oliviformis]MBN7813686.1 FxsB family radical SAM/SPASM domain protein [Algoriphagus oliviformis]
MIPFHSFIFKVASRCNLNCSYCYVYNLADTTWKEQPVYISEKTFELSCIKIREHCESHSKKEISVSFHGGEPLLIGAKKLHKLGGIIKSELTERGIYVNFGMQTNLLLFNEEIGDFFLEHKGSIGVSIDGPPHINDIYRIDHKGRGSSKILEKKMQLLTSSTYKSVFSGILSVVNVDTDPIEVIKYLLSFNPPMIDLLFPDDNYDRLPKGKEKSIKSTLIADWLISVFDFWFYSESNTKIRVLENIVKLIIGGNSNVESIGTSPVDFIFIEANGDIEILDTLKSTYNGATKIQYNIHDNDFNEVAKHSQVRSRQLGVDVLCNTCKNCNLVDVCGGGYLPNRYSSINQFDNPSIYCADLQKIINHIYQVIEKEFSYGE